MLVQKNKIFSLKGKIYSVNLYFYEVYKVFPVYNMAEHNELGRRGEEAAVKYFEKKGCRIIERNWTFHGYEVDIIAEDDEFIIFAEVKTRATSDWGNPEESVGRQRMRRMINSASHYLKLNQIDKPARFDIIAIVWNREDFELEHFEDAFMSFL